MVVLIRSKYFFRSQTKAPIIMYNYLCTEFLIAKVKIHTTTCFACCPEAIKVLLQSGIKYVKIWHVEFMVSNKCKFPCEKKKKLPPFMDYNQDVADELLMHGKKTMGHPNFLEGIFHYFRDKVVPSLLKLIKSPSITKHKDIASLLEDEERDETKNKVSFVIEPSVSLMIR